MYYNWKDKTNTEELKIICNLIRNGELVIFPTETVYGIGANALDENAVGKIFIAKGRPSDNPLIVHIADKRMINEIAQDITEMEQILIDNFMPGPFTLILKRKPIIPNIVTAGLDTVAIRMPDNIIARGIIQFSGVPIAAPSANISGKPSGTNIEDIRKELEGKVSAIVDGGETPIGIESTVVKVVDEIPIILRPGRVTPEDIEKVARIVKIDDKIFIHRNGLIFGPYMDILKGEYKLRVNCEDLTSDMLLNVTAENGTKQISSFTLKNGENSLKIDFDEEINKDVEFVIHSSEEFIITGISIKK